MNISAHLPVKKQLPVYIWFYNWGDHRWTVETHHSSHLSIHIHLQGVLATLFV